MVDSGWLNGAPTVPTIWRGTVIFIAGTAGLPLVTAATERTARAVISHCSGYRRAWRDAPVRAAPDPLARTYRVSHTRSPFAHTEWNLAFGPARTAEALALYFMPSTR